MRSRRRRWRARASASASSAASASAWPRRWPGVRRVYASQANFLLVRFGAAQSVHDRLLAHGVVVRDMRAAPQLHDALRISLGTPGENDALLRAIAEGTP